MKKQKLIIPTIIALGASIAANGAYADTASTDFSITVNPSASLTVSAASVNLQITPNKSGVYDSASLDVTASTNSTAGYTLTMATSNTSLTSSTINVNTGTNPTIPSIAESQTGISAADFAASTDSNVLNHWGLAIGNSNFNAIKSEQTIKTTDTNITNDTTTLTMASKLDLLTVPGIYSTTLNFEMTVNPVPDTLDSAFAKAGKQKTTIAGKQYYKMQDMQSIICDDVDVIEEQMQVYDKRDNKIYWIAKLADGNCWMTQNLDLDLETNPTNVLALDHDNTDLGWTNTDTTVTWTPANSTITIANGEATGWSATPSAVMSADAGNIYVYPSGGSTSGTSYTTAASCAQAENISEAECAHYHVGNYYSFKAAIAGSATAYQQSSADSICPAGWKLPAGAVSNVLQEYVDLLEAYDLVTVNQARSSAQANTGMGVAMRQAPLYLVDAGEVRSDGVHNKVGTRLSYYTGSSNGTDGHVLQGDVTNGDSYYTFGDSTMASYIGYSVRCLAR